jgi:hypothetical protein
MNKIPNYSSFKFRNEVDRYGASFVFAERLKLRYPPRSFSYWVHGWCWSDHPDPELLGCRGLGRKTRVVVRSDSERIAMLNGGFTDIVVGGLPFAYLPNLEIKRNSDWLLVIPAHSAGSEVVRSGHEDYLDFIYSLSNQFENISVCIHHLDVGREIEKQARRRGLSVIYGARPNDRNSLHRIKYLFSLFEYITSNTMGSHMVYALSSGAKFSFCGPFYEYDPDVFLCSKNILGHSRDYVSKVLSMQSETYVRVKFPNFFKDSPRSGVIDTDWARLQLASSLLSDKDLIYALGWTVVDQISGYTKGVYHRAKRVAIKGLRFDNGVG